MLHIAPKGIFALLTETYIEAASATTPAVLNYGKVELLGRTVVANYSQGGHFAAAPFSDAASLGSLTSRLGVYGQFKQTSTGSTTIYLNQTYQHAPVMYLINSENYGGSVYVQFYTSTANDIYPDLFLFDGSTPSTWSVIAFRDKYSDNSLLAFDELTLHAPNGGLVFSQDTSVYYRDNGTYHRRSGEDVK